MTGVETASGAGLAPVAERFMTGEEPGASGDFPGFVLLAARHGDIVEHAARGWALRYAVRDGRVAELDAGRVAMRPDTIFDVASLSKLFTAVVAVRLAELGELELASPVSRYLPGFWAVPVQSLLTHTSGLPAEIGLAAFADRASRLAAVAAQAPLAAPGTRYVYSDVGLITLGLVVEAVAGAPLDQLVARLITGPLGMTDTCYRPARASWGRIAATEHQPSTGRGVVRGTVHDENAYLLGGVAGHAGIFATARDLGVLAQTMLNGGSLGGTTVLGEEWTRRMLRDHNGHLGPGAARGLGWQLGQPDWMGRLASPAAFGHTGFTGTSLLADPAAGALLVLLTNRVHPSRAGGPGNACRRAVADALLAGGGRG